jgi:hypothetical protein
MTYGCAELIVPLAREGHRPKFSEVDKRQIVEQAAQRAARLSEVARHYGIAAHVLFPLEPGTDPDGTAVHDCRDRGCAPPTVEHAS